MTTQAMLMAGPGKLPERPPVGAMALFLVRGNGSQAATLFKRYVLPGEECAAIGLLDRLVAPADLAATAHALAAEIALSAPLAVASIRQTMRGHLAQAIRDATDREGAEQDRLRRTSDFAEGIRATAERRPPRFEGK